MVGPTCPSSRYRALAMVVRDFSRAWRDVFVGEAIGQPAASQVSITWANEAARSRRGGGSRAWARSDRSWSRSRWAAALSTRSTLRRAPSGKRTQAIHRPALSFQRTVGFDAIQTPRRSRILIGYAQPGYATHSPSLRWK